MEENPRSAAPFVEIKVCNPETKVREDGKYTDYEIRMKTNMPLFAVAGSSVRRRYRDFEWLREELVRTAKLSLPQLPGKALRRSIPFLSDGGRFDESFIEERREALQKFLNEVVHMPIARIQKCLHMFLLDGEIDIYYKPGQVKIQ